jgi:plastocyanin
MPHLHARPLTRSFISGIVALAAVLLVGGGVAVAATRTVTISDFAFSPRTLTINVGDTVRWRNSDPVAHTATATGGAFTVAGTYRYICTPHPTMTGTIRVRAASGGSGLPATDTIVSLSPDEQRVDAGAGPAMIAAGATLLVALVIARRRRTA